MSKPTKHDPTTYDKSPIAWFAELNLALDDGDLMRAVGAQQQLVRLGWRVRRLPSDHRASASG
jgi:hypothetical protein